MATWINLSVDSWRAAALLERKRHCRSSMSRSYYAAYAAVTAELSKATFITFGYGGNNPAHSRLLEYIQHGFPGLGHSTATIEEVRKAVRDLRRDRERADYIPSDAISEDDARECLRQAEQVLVTLRLPI